MALGWSSLLFLPRPEQATLSKLQNLLQVLEDDLAGHLDEKRPKLANELAQSKRRAFGFVVPGGRTRVTVDDAVPLDDQPAQLRIAGCPAPRGALQERGCRGGPEKIGKRAPKDGEEGGNRE